MSELSQNQTPLPDKHDERIRKSLRYSILDGAGWAAMAGFGDSFFGVFAVFLGATNLQMSLLASLPSTLGSVSQYFSYRILNFLRSRKTFVAICVFCQALMFIPLGLVYFMGVHRTDLLILFVSFYLVFGLLGVPAWNSWMGDLVNINEKGRFFGRRSRVTGLMTFLSFIAGGILLQRIGDQTGNKYYGFVAIFVLACASRFCSFYFLTRKYEPEYRLGSDERPRLRDYLEDPKLRNFTYLALYISFMSFSIFISAPFFTPYMLKDLKFNYTAFTLVVAASAIVRFFTLSIWGRLCDIYGTRKVLTISGFLMPAIPFFWVFSGNVWFLVAAQCYNGFMWAGFEISSFNYMYDTTRPTNRVTSISYFNIANGIAIFLGALFGNLLVKYSHLFWSVYLIAFLISGIFRYAASFMFLSRLKEERKVRTITYGKLLLHVFSSIPTTEYMFRAYTVVRNSRLIEDTFSRKK
jgi:MFS family permease